MLLPSDLSPQSTCYLMDQHSTSHWCHLKSWTAQIQWRLCTPSASLRSLRPTPVEVVLENVHSIQFRCSCCIHCSEQSWIYSSIQVIWKTWSWVALCFSCDAVKWQPANVHLTCWPLKHLNSYCIICVYNLSVCTIFIMLQGGSFRSLCHSTPELKPQPPTWNVDTWWVNP